jgi:hypothetical protein
MASVAACKSAMEGATWLRQEKNHLVVVLF